MGKVENMETNETIEANEANESNETRKTTFNSLTPDILEENKQVYTDALNYAFSNDDIRNIAITGVYGAGKSTVWNTYKKNRISGDKANSPTNPFKNIITISIGGYDYYSKAEDNKDQEILKSMDWEESRIERLIIKQMLAQIKQEKIPLAKYQFKKNKNSDVINEEVFLSGLFVMSVLSWIFRDSIAVALQNCLGEFNATLWIMFLSLASFFYAGQKILFKFFTFNKLKFSTIKFQGAEANFKEEIDDEVGLEKNSKEIVYLLASSDTNVVVFEDLDRFNKNVVFSKLKELNYLLNSYLKTNEEERIVRFVYLTRDGLFYSKDRTKFFDFIIPIVPVVNSSTSMDKISFLFMDSVQKPDDKILKKISLYIDDMRIIRNIVNEYKIYSNILPMENVNLDYNKLFALITLKNTFPNDYQLLQEDRGYVRSVILKLEEYRQRLMDEVRQEVLDLNEKSEKNDQQYEEIFERMASLIPNDISIVGKDSDMGWVEFLLIWSKKKGVYEICRNSEIKKYDFEEFCTEFILKNRDKVDELLKNIDDYTVEIENQTNQFRESPIKWGNYIDLQWYKLIELMNENEKDQLFNETQYKIVEDHYFPLIKYLFTSGLLDQTYRYYMTDFVDEENDTLTSKDRLFMKSLSEEKSLDVFFKVDTPSEIIKRLTTRDFQKRNILNYYLLDYCVKVLDIVGVISISQSIKLHDSWEGVYFIFNKWSVDQCIKYLEIIIFSDNRYLASSILGTLIEKKNDETGKLHFILEYLANTYGEEFNDDFQKYYHKPSF